MARLRGAVQRLIVQRLACDHFPSEIAREVQDAFGVTVTLSQIAYYNPRSAGTDLSKDLRRLYSRTRRRYLHDMKDLSLAHRPARIRKLERYVEKLEARGNVALAAQLVQQAAKEMETASLELDDASPYLPAPLRIEEETDDERRAREAAAAASYDRQRRGELNPLSEDDAA